MYVLTKVILDIKIVFDVKIGRAICTASRASMDEFYQLEFDDQDFASKQIQELKEYEYQYNSSRGLELEQEDSLLFQKVNQEVSGIVDEVKSSQSWEESHSDHIKAKQLEPDSLQDRTPIAKLIKKGSSLKSEGSLKESTTTTRTHTSSRKSITSITSSKKRSGSKKRAFRILSQEECSLAELLFRGGHTLKLVTSRLKISQQTAKRLEAQFELYGRITPTEGAINAINMAKQRQSQHQAIIDIIKEELTKNCSITLKDMQKALKERGIHRSLSTIYSYLEKMKYTRKKLQKVPLQRNSLNMLKYRQNYCKMILQIPLEKQVFMDETIFGLQTSGHYGWALKGEQPKVFVPANKKKHVTLLAAISVRGFEATRLIKGPVTSKHICQFLQHYLDHLQPDEVLILDNARMHHAAVVKEKIKAINRNVRYLPAYTPQLNPIQNVFSQIKVQYVRLKQDNELSVQDMIKLIGEAIKNMRSKTFGRYYEHYEEWLKKGVAGQLFG